MVVMLPSTTGSGGKNPENNGSGSKPILSLPSPQLFRRGASCLATRFFLVQVEKAGRFWPFATCVAVDKETLLTSGKQCKWPSGVKTRDSNWVSPRWDQKEIHDDPRARHFCGARTNPTTGSTSTSPC